MNSALVIDPSVVFAPDTIVGVAHQVGGSDVTMGATSIRRSRENRLSIWLVLTGPSA